MAMNPEKQKLLQEELDRVIVDKLPTVEDRPSLPYLEAATKETMRWHPALCAILSSTCMFFLTISSQQAP